MRERNMSKTTEKMVCKVIDKFGFYLNNVAIDVIQMKKELESVKGFLNEIMDIDMINADEYVTILVEVNRLYAEKVAVEGEVEGGVEGEVEGGAEDVDPPFTYSYILSYRGVRKIVKNESYYFGELVNGDEDLEELYRSGVIYIGDWRVEFIPELDSEGCDIMSRRVLITEVKWEYV